MINDFGEKIGGARKDVWKERGLWVEDLDGMTQGEKEKYVKKDCVWPKEDMKSLVADGTSDILQSLCNFPLHWEDVSVSSFPLPVRMHLPNY